MDDVIQQAHDAMVARDWAALRPLLHPYLQWTDADGTVIRGRNQVLTRLEHGSSPAAPASVELRDRQIYRWRCG